MGYRPHTQNLMPSSTPHRVEPDFDDCGFDYRIYDVAVALWELRHRDDYPAFKAQPRTCVLSSGVIVVSSFPRKPVAL